MSTCPACGVAVVPGYARCPKCKAPLPMRTTTGPLARDASGTALPEPSRFPIAAVLAAVGVAVAIIVVFALRGGNDTRPVAPTVPAGPTTTQPTVAPVAVETPVTAPTAPTAAPPDAAPILKGLQDTLRRQRVWVTLERAGSRVDLRGTGCTDPQLGPLLDAVAAPLKAAGITKIRCLAQAGAVVSDRDL